MIGNILGRRQRFLLSLVVVLIASRIYFSDRSPHCFVLHRVGNPAEIYIAKFDGMDSGTLNELSCNDFKGFVEKLMPETGPVKCSPFD